MSFRQRGTRRAGRLALLWCALLWGAAETGGAIAPPCAEATPYFTTSTAGVKPVGDPDTPDEGGHKNNLTRAGSVVVSPGVSTAPAAELGSWSWFMSWLLLFTGHFYQG